MKTLPIALQLFSIREEAQQDFAKAMQKVKQMGYDGVELAGLYDHTPEEIRDILNNVGLIPMSAHVAYQEIMENIENTIHKYASIGCGFIAIPYLMEEDRYGSKSYEEFLKNIPVIAEACKKEGITLLYHNHDFEFKKTTEGRYVLDALYQSFPKSQLQVELDTCWTKVAGEEPVAYMKKYENRLPVVHLKDYISTNPVVFAAVGHGVQDIASILEQAVKGGSQWVVVEQDSHTQNTAMEDARISREYLRSLGW
jgi:sugar phosphate isomerase/epimerase